MKTLRLLLAVSLTIFVAALLGQSPKPTMKAVVVHEYGGPEVLKYEDVARPEPKNDELLVRVNSAGVNPVDRVTRSEKQFLNVKLPAIPGYDIAGVVEKTGGKITKFKTGDPVYAYIALDKGGGYADTLLPQNVKQRSNRSPLLMLTLQRCRWPRKRRGRRWLIPPS